MTLAELNALPEQAAFEALEKCCGSRTWIRKMLAARPYADADALFAAADAAWSQCAQSDGLEAFTHHPKIGGMEALAKKFATTQAWASGEQSAVKQASTATLQALADGNEAYERKFGYIFIVCATGKSADEMLALLHARLPNAPEQEIGIAMAEQMKITRIRLEKLLAS